MAKAQPPETKKVFEADLSGLPALKPTRRHTGKDNLASDGEHLISALGQEPSLEGVLIPPTREIVERLIEWLKKG